MTTVKLPTGPARRRLFAASRATFLLASGALTPPRGRGQGLGPRVWGGAWRWSEARIAQGAGPEEEQGQDWVAWGPGGGV